MAEARQISKVVINKKAIFKFKEFYDFLYQLVSSQGFAVKEDIFSNDGVNASFEWTCVSLVDDYTKYSLWIQVKVEGLQPVKVKRGKIVEPQEKATVKVTMKGKIVTDWQNRWGTNPVTKFLKGVFDKYLLGSVIKSREKELNRKVNIIKDEVKSFFDLPRFM